MKHTSKLQWLLPGAVALGVFVLFQAVGALGLGAGYFNNQTNLATAAALRFHTQYNAGQYQSIYNEASPDLRKAIRPADFFAFLARSRQRYGPVLQAARSGVDAYPDGRTTLAYDTRFRHDAATELFGWQSDGNKAVLTTYQIMPGTGETRAQDRDAAEASKVADRFLQHLKDRSHDAAYGLASSRLKSTTSRQTLVSDLDGQLQGGQVQSWTFQSQRPLAGEPRRIALIYRVQATRSESDWELKLELTKNPPQWRIWSVKPVNTPQAVQNAREASAVAEQFLIYLQDHEFASAQRLLAPPGAKPPAAPLQNRWRQMEGRSGQLRGRMLESHADTSAVINGKRESLTMLLYQLQGSRSTGGIILTMTKTGGSWRIAGLELRDILPD